MKNPTSISIVRWTASIIGTLMVAFTLIFFIGSMFEGRNKPGPGLDTYTIITFVVWGIGLAALLLALWKPGIGGLISLLSFIVFNILAAVNPNADSSYSVVLLIFLLPSILFLLFCWMKKSSVNTFKE
ncbi:MAG: hypothetical protein NTW54_05435 [Bacteroidetes bacterium]|nr:hypothetical protein [Bacteroidota bacterium]